MTVDLDPVERDTVPGGRSSTGVPEVMLEPVEGGGPRVHLFVGGNADWLLFPVAHEVVRAVLERLGVPPEQEWPAER